jgi:hypothetical protein
METGISYVGSGWQVKTEIEWIGEGLDGDYNPGDPNDVPLLRFSVYKKINGQWEAMDDASYCTQLPATITTKKALEAAGQILSLVEDTVLKGGSIKKICEKLSWIDVSWLEKPESDEEDIT